MKKRIIWGWVMVPALLLGCTKVPNGMQPVSGFQIERYMGQWYEIVRLDHRFERNLSRVSATYSLTSEGYIRVENRGYNTETGQWKSVQGKARFIGDETMGSIKVSFFGPFYGGYHIIDLDQKDYQYAMVVGPSRDYFWILSRSPDLADDLLETLLAKAAGLGIDTTSIIRVDQGALAGEG
ncbi:MAG: lipocalin family protein [Desulfobacterales bacterium]